MKISGLFTYPVKSFTGISHQFTELTNKGLLYDRHWMLIDDKSVAITARDYPKLLHLSVKLTDSKVEIYSKGNTILSFPLKPNGITTENLTIFSSTASGVIYDQVINNWFSNYLGTNARLAVVNENQARNVRQKHGGSVNDIVGFADQNPILIISEGSLSDLNSKLEKPVTMTHFRPNIVVTGDDPFIEDGWKYVKVGNCELEIVQPCMRCVFTTIDPITAVKDQNKEPIRTLSKYRQMPNGIAFGMHAIPRKTGVLNIGDTVSII